MKSHATQHGLLGLLVAGALLAACAPNDSERTTQRTTELGQRNQAAQTQWRDRPLTPAEHGEVADYAPVYSLVQHADGSASLVETGRLPVQRIGGSNGFGAYPCTDDCSGHEAGYQWAEDNSIRDPDDCGGNSNSFIEGCITYAEEQIEDDAGADNE